MTTKTKTLRVPIEVIIEAAQALRQGKAEARLTAGDDDEGTVIIKVEYDSSSSLAQSAIGNVETMIRQFEQFRYRRTRSGSEV